MKFLHQVYNTGFLAKATGLTFFEPLSVVAAVHPETGAHVHPINCGDGFQHSIIAGGVAGLDYSGSLGRVGREVVFTFPATVQSFIVATHNEVPPVVEFSNKDNGTFQPSPLESGVSIRGILYLDRPLAYSNGYWFWSGKYTDGPYTETSDYAYNGTQGYVPETGDTWEKAANNGAQRYELGTFR